MCSSDLAWSPTSSSTIRGFPLPPAAAPAAGGWGNPGSLPSGVNRVVRVLADSALEVEVLPVRMVVSPDFPLCVVVLLGAAVGLASFGAQRSSDLLGLCPLRAGGETSVSVACVGVSVLRPCRRCAVVSSSGGAGLVGWCVGGGLVWLAGRSGPLRGGHLGGDLHGGDFGLVSRWCSAAISGGRDGGASVSVFLAGRGGEEGNGDAATAVGLSWWGFVEVGLLLRLPLLVVMKTTRWWWLGEVSPPMIVKRLRFRLSSRMDLAVRQRSVSAIEPRLPVGVWKPVLLPLRRCFGGVGGWEWRPWWCLGGRKIGRAHV